MQEYYLMEVTVSEQGAGHQTEYTGKRGEGGTIYREHRLAMRINLPCGVVYDSEGILYFTLVGDSKILRIDTASGLGEPFCDISLFPVRLQMDKFSNEIYFTRSYGFGVVEVIDGVPQVRDLISGEGNAFGTFSETGVNLANGLVQVDENLWLICDGSNNR